MRLASGDKPEEKSGGEGGTTTVSTLVTSDGTYATQSVFSANVYVSRDF